MKLIAFYRSRIARPTERIAIYGGKIPSTPLWNNAIYGSELKVNKLFKNYKSTVDWPSVAFLPSLFNRYPEAKVILTMRDPAEWFESASATIFKAMLASERNPNSEARERIRMSRRLVLEQVFDSKYSDKEHCINVYNRHIAKVQKLVPRNQLLMYKISDGWGPLCDFLNTPIPAKQFPKTNDRQTFLAKKPNWAKSS